MGFIFQNYNLVPDLNIYENVVLPIELDGKRVDWEFVEEILDVLKLTEKGEAFPGNLSGGQQQRAAIARALASKPAIILADEPTGNLDSKSGKIVIDALERINRKMKKTIIMVTHDPQVASHCKRIIFLKDGVILEDLRRKGASEEEFYEKIIERMKDL